MLLDVLWLPLDNSRSSPGKSAYRRPSRSRRLLGPLPWHWMAPCLLALLSLWCCSFCSSVSSHTIGPLAVVLGALTAPAPGAGLPALSGRLLWPGTPGSHAHKSCPQIQHSGLRSRAPLWAFPSGLCVTYPEFQRVGPLSVLFPKVTQYLGQFLAHSRNSLILEGEGGMIWKDSIETYKYHMQNRWPVWVRCMKQGTQSQCSGPT